MNFSCFKTLPVLAFLYNGIDFLVGFKEIIVSRKIVIHKLRFPYEW